MHRKYKRTLIGGASAVGLMVGISLLSGSPAFAATLNPHIEITTEATIGSTALEFKGTNERATTEYYVPVKIDYQDVRDFKVFIYATNETDLSEGNADADGLYPGVIDDDHSVCEASVGADWEGNIIEEPLVCKKIVSLLDLNDKNRKLQSVTNAINRTVLDMTNAWGYRYNLANGKQATDLPTGLYKAMPSAYSAPAERNIANVSIDAGTMDSSGTGTKYLNLGFGAGITKSQAAGTYSGNAIVSVVATPYYVDLFDMQTRGMAMQDMTSEICEATPLPSKTATEPAHSRSEITYVDGYANKIPEVALVDRRQVGTKDGEPVYYSYLVSKLADGNCWMLQNLALPGETTVTSADSDVVADYTLPQSEIQGKFASSDTGFMYNGSHQDQAYDTQGYAENQNKGGTYCSNSSYTDCKGGNSGAYYSWLVVTAGTGTSSLATQYTNAPSSICPKNWRLPTGSNTIAASLDSTPIQNGQLKALHNTYGNDATFTQVWHGGNGDNTSETFTGYINSGKLESSGRNSIWWSSTILSDTNIYVISHDASIFAPGINRSRYMGFSVRCVAR